MVAIFSHRRCAEKLAVFMALSAWRSKSFRPERGLLRELNWFSSKMGWSASGQV